MKNKNTYKEQSKWTKIFRIFFLSAWMMFVYYLHIWEDWYYFPFLIGIMNIGYFYIVFLFADCPLSWSMVYLPDDDEKSNSKK